MKRYYKLILITVPIFLIGCGSGNNHNNLNQKVTLSSSSESEVIKSICGSSNVSSFFITEKSGAPLNNSFTMNEKRQLALMLSCNNGVTSDLTNIANWISSDTNVLTITTGIESAQNGLAVAYNTGITNISAYLVKGGKLTANARLNVLPNHDSTELSSISATIDGGNNLAIGQLSIVKALAIYSDGTTQIINNPTVDYLTSQDKSIISIDNINKTIKGVKAGTFNIKVSYSYNSGESQLMKQVVVSGNVLPATIVGIRIKDDNLKTFSTVIPRSVNVTGQYILSDGTYQDVPKSVDYIERCSLYFNPTDKLPSFINSDNSCNITSMAEIGQSRLTYRFSAVKSDGTIDTSKASFESSIIISVTNTGLKSISIGLKDSYSTIISDHPYRYNIYANMSNGQAIDITKLASTNVTCTLGTTDCTNNVLNSNTGLIGVDQHDDENGGFFTIMSGVTNQYKSIIYPTLTFATKFNGFESKISLQHGIYPSIWSINALSNYFVTNVYPYENSSEQSKFTTFTFVDENGLPISNNSKNAFAALNASQLIASQIGEDKKTLQISGKVPGSIVAIQNINLPSSKQFNTLLPSQNLFTHGCNSSSVQTNVTTQLASKLYTNTYTLGETALLEATNSTDISTEVNLAGQKTVTKETISFKISSTTNMSTTQTTTSTYTLPSQIIPTPPHTAIIVYQQMFSASSGGTYNFTLPLNSNSCIPFVINADLTIFNINSYACQKLTDLSTDTTSRLGEFGVLLAEGNTKYNFQATYKGNQLDDTLANSISIYMFPESDPNYAAICANTSQTNLSISNSMEPGILYKGGNQVVYNGKIITLDPNRLVSLTSRNY